MPTGDEPRRGGLGGILFCSILAALVLYLGFAALQGEHGLFSLFQLEAEEHHLGGELISLRLSRAEVTNKIERLSPSSLDAELLDEQSRSVLGLGKPDELIFP